MFLFVEMCFYRGLFFGQLIFLLNSTILSGQEIDVLLKGGHIIDVRHDLDAIMDVAIKDGLIHEVGKNIDPAKARKVVNVAGLWVCPGLIDIHTHVFYGSQVGKFANGRNSLAPDDIAPRAGITTMVDAGTSGWKNFPQFKKQVIETSKTRVLAFINIASNGMTGDSLEEDISEMKVRRTIAMIKEYPDDIVGVKIGHFRGKAWTPFDRALSVTKKTKRPLFVECHLPEYTLEAQLDRMRAGDIITHSFEKVSERMSVIDDDGRVRPFVFAAKEKGVLFDVGHGGAGFWFSEALPALEQGLAPTSFGSDLHRFSVNAGMKDLLNIMSKYLAMGMPFKDVIACATWSAAKSIRRHDLGHLGVGTVADIAVLRLREGRFGFVDAGKNRIEGNQRFEAELTMRGGAIIYDLNGLSATPFQLEK